MPAQLVTAARRWWHRTAPVPAESRAALDRRWSELPESARTPSQVLGRQAVGCEGTHGVFPRCNLTCTPCYHSADANKVRVDAEHTLTQVRAQMEFLRTVRGPRAHAQLIGGEVSLLDPQTHAAVLEVMREHGREPMSFTHGDFDEDYLLRLALDADGRPRFGRLSFAAHFDSLMRGRRGLPRPRSEAEVQEHRERFSAMFDRLGRRGVRSYLAHNMTVTPANVDQVADVVRNSLARTGFSMYSFQPAAYVGDERRWREDLRSLSPDDVWAQVEAGVGCRLPHRAVQFGDPRCNRTSFGWMVGPRFVPVLVDDDPADLHARDVFLSRLGGIQLGGLPRAVVAARLLRAVAANLAAAGVALGWARRAVRRSGGLRAVAAALVRGRVRPMTFVMHVFMDAEVVEPAWQLMLRDEVSDDPAVRAAQERLGACAYAMAHPELGRTVPACVQHSVLDPEANARLRRLLPLEVAPRSSGEDRPRGDLDWLPSG